MSIDALSLTRPAKAVPNSIPLDKPVTCPVLIGRTRELAALHSLNDLGEPPIDI